MTASLAAIAAPTADESAPHPLVSAIDAIDDADWFDRNATRRCRARSDARDRVWLVRRRGEDVYLRTTALAKFPANRDLPIAVGWYEIAFALARNKAIKAARKTLRRTGR